MPEIREGYPVWSHSAEGLELRFTGRGPFSSGAAARSAAGVPTQAAWARQIHSARVLTARPGPCGEGDALITDATGLALSIAVADCVPVAVSGGGKLALIHAGWKGIARRIIPATVTALDVRTEELAAWVGPAIGACCYEVGADVAGQVAAASDESTMVHRDGRRRPTLDLQRAVAIQLRSTGIVRIDTLAICTRCEGERLWSYRALGADAGRNFAFAWRPPTS